MTALSHWLKALTGVIPYVHDELVAETICGFDGPGDNEWSVGPFSEIADEDARNLSWFRPKEGCREAGLPAGPLLLL